MIKHKLKIAKTDFWSATSEEEVAGEFFDIIRNNYDLEISEEPDLLFCSVFGSEHWNYDCMKFYISYEHPKAQRSHVHWDYGLSGFPTDAKNFHSFLFVYANYFHEWMWGDSDYLQTLKTHPKDRFCNFFHRSGGISLRERFCKKLMQRKHVDCPGLILNNMRNQDDPNLSIDENKLEFLKHYRFTLCFDNYSHPCYMAEKLPQALIAGSIPIYWGCPSVAEYFNPDGMINCHDYLDFDALIDHIMEVENNPVLYRQYTQAKAVLPESKLYDMSPELLLDRFDHIVSRIGQDKPYAQTYYGRLMRILNRTFKPAQVRAIMRMYIRIIASKIDFRELF